MNKRQAKQTAHAIADNVLTTILMDGAVHEYACDDAPHCGPCQRCKDAESIEAALMQLRDRHRTLACDHREHDLPNTS